MKPAMKNLLLFVMVIIVLGIVGFVLWYQDLLSGKSPYEKGEEALQNGQYAKAIEHYNSALAKDKQNAKLYARIGLCYAKMQEDDKAILFYESAASFDTLNASYYTTLGKLYSNQQQYFDAVAYYERSLELAPDNAEVLRALGDVYMEIGDRELAQEYYTRAEAITGEMIPTEPAETEEATTPVAETTTPPPTQPSTEPAPTRSTPTTSSSFSGKMQAKPTETYPYTIQVNASRTIDKAREIQSTLKEKGFESYITQKYIPNQGLFYRVRIGGFATRQEAIDYGKQVSQKTNLDSWVSRVF